MKVWLRGHGRGAIDTPAVSRRGLPIEQDPMIFRTNRVAGIACGLARVWLYPLRGETSLLVDDRIRRLVLSDRRSGPAVAEEPDESTN